MTTFVANAPANSLTEQTKLTHAMAANVTVGGNKPPTTGQLYPPPAK